MESTLASNETLGRARRKKLIPPSLHSRDKFFDVIDELHRLQPEDANDAHYEYLGVTVDAFNTLCYRLHITPRGRRRRLELRATLLGLAQCWTCQMVTWRLGEHERTIRHWVDKVGFIFASLSCANAVM